MSSAWQDPGRSAAQAAQQAADAAAKAAAAAEQAIQAATKTQVTSTTVTNNLEQLSYRQLRARLNELQNQRQTIANRRGALADSYENASGANREGMAARLTIMDNNIVQLEADIIAVGREMANKAGTTTQPVEPPPGNNGNWQEGDVFGLAFTVFLATMFVTTIVSRRFGRRRWNAMNQGQQPNQIQSNERLDRIEQAVDTIAVEIERVSENQRFMTRLMTETQLGSTINEVRKSTELAKSAASNDPAAT